MSLKRTLTNVAVDSFRDYLRERLEEVKQLDLDQDGRKDIDQVNELLGKVAERVKESVDATDIPKLAAGLDQIMTGACMIGSSIDREKLSEALTELGGLLSQLGKLAQLGVREVRDRREKGS